MYMFRHILSTLSLVELASFFICFSHIKYLAPSENRLRLSIIVWVVGPFEYTIVR